MKFFRTFAVLATLFLFGALPLRADDASASKLYVGGRFDAAAAAFAAALAANPADRTAQLSLGALRLYQNDLVAAEPLLRAAAADPNNARAAGLLLELERRKAELARRTTVDGGETTVPFVTSDPLPVVRATIDGKDGNFLIDTGGTVDLETDFAAGLNLATHDSGMGTFAGGKQAPIRSAMLKSVSLGGATAYDVPAHVLATHAGALFAGVHVDGVIGTTLFERFLATVDYPKQRLILRERSAEASARFQAASVAAGAAIVPCWLVSDHFVFARAQVNGAPAGLFIFDSGLAGGGVLATTELVGAAHLQLDRAHAEKGMGGGGEVGAIPFVAERVAVGDAAQANVQGIYMPQGGPPFPFEMWGGVSDEFLKHYAYTVDFDAMKIVLAPPGAETRTPAP